MLSLLNALQLLRDGINGKYNDLLAALILLANKVKANEVVLATKASTASVTAVDNRVTTVQGDVTSLTTLATSLNDAVLTNENKVTLLTQLLVNASVKEVVYMTDGLATPTDLLNTIAFKVNELGADVVNQQYTLNVEGSKSFTYDVTALDGTVTTETVSVNGAGKVLAVVKDGAIVGVSAISYPQGTGGVIEIPVADVTTVTPDAESTVAGILALLA